MSSVFFFFNDTATTEIYTLSLHDALPISLGVFYAENIAGGANTVTVADNINGKTLRFAILDRKSTRLNSSHDQISYAVFCLKKKKKSKPDSTSEERVVLTGRLDESSRDDT